MDPVVSRPKKTQLRRSPFQKQLGTARPRPVSDVIGVWVELLGSADSPRDSGEYNWLVVTGT